jgi:hypothetical protein
VAFGCCSSALLLCESSLFYLVFIFFWGGRK